MSPQAAVAVSAPTCFYFRYVYQAIDNGLVKICLKTKHGGVYGRGNVEGVGATVDLDLLSNIDTSAREVRMQQVVME